MTEEGKVTVAQILAGVEPTPASYLSANRTLLDSEYPNGTAAKIAFLSSYNGDLLDPYLRVECAKVGLVSDLYTGPFGQFEQEIFERKSGLHAFDPDFVCLALRLEEIAPVLVERYVSMSLKDIAKEIDAIELRIKGLVDMLTRDGSTTILVANFALPVVAVAGLADNSLEDPQVTMVQSINDRIATLCREMTDTFVWDFSRVSFEVGALNMFDPRMYWLARMPFSAVGLIGVARSLARHVRAICMVPKKCLVLDLDGTLWGGVVGEDGVGGILLGEDYPGNVFKGFQRYLKGLRDRGILLAIASKNNEADALEVFETHPDCFLQLDDFAALEINWNDKASSLTEIARTLNIGIDALVFFDDNPVERQWVRSRLPEVTVIEVPEQAFQYGQAIEESVCFESLVISLEDRARAETYKIERRRRDLAQTSTSIEDFLKTLEMTATVGWIGTKTMPRVAQLIGKTNQFNLTVRRHSEAELQGMLNDGALGLWMRVSDRFGDNGLVGVALATPLMEGEWELDSFLLSCRVIGRRVEQALLGLLIQEISERGGTCLRGSYVQSKKNQIVADLLPNMGFVSEDGGDECWVLDLANYRPLMPETIDIVREI